MSNNYCAYCAALGFAFVDYSSSKEAELAMESLKSAHLYGRHLVIEWAKAEEEEPEGLCVCDAYVYTHTCNYTPYT